VDVFVYASGGDWRVLEPEAPGHNLAGFESWPMIKPADSLAAFRGTVSARLANIERAAARALRIGGGVVIW